jgi:2-keto-4-pentenoate hydratase/2-oxohepta-3-ene-1,7-dioic acid hydratase in catechol pathway
MKWVTYADGAAGRLGALLRDGTVLDVAQAAALTGGRPVPAAMQAFIEAGEPAWDAARQAVARAPDEARRPGVALLAPLPRPIRLRDCSLFLEHMEVALEKIAAMARERGETPTTHGLPPVYRQQVIYYNADHVHVVGPEAEIAWPAHSDWMDYELEWACVVGRTGTDIRPERAREHIFGLTLFNDWSARDLQLPFMAANLGPGEGKDFANSLGPCIATLDEFEGGDPYTGTLTATVNGERWSHGSTSRMHHRFEDAIVQFSRGKTLFAGEVFGSGTVLGGCGFELGRRLADGDVVELSHDVIGTLRNRIRRQQVA